MDHCGINDYVRRIAFLFEIVEYTKSLLLLLILAKSLYNLVVRIYTREMVPSYHRMENLRHTSVVPNLTEP
ncbi:hypothetical protein EUTSA_v10015205mg [Eutrema salsugineum]|uniref:Uncharacterized protein n=1 Tax=Eutrema salsugineum TaxID=72664 RepID=V4LHK0_EUTSA|nr:hypothetical protein EUTSA_v10015205mg [Eutrema salsugineum]